jgi:hypothetical protein
MNNWEVVIHRSNSISGVNERRHKTVEAETEAEAVEKVRANVRKVMDDSASFMRYVFQTPETVIQALYQAETVNIVSIKPLPTTKEH